MFNSKFQYLVGLEKTLSEGLGNLLAGVFSKMGERVSYLCRWMGDLPEFPPSLLGDVSDQPGNSWSLLMDLLGVSLSLLVVLPLVGDIISCLDGTGISLVLQGDFRSSPLPWQFLLDLSEGVREFFLLAPSYPKMTHSNSCTRMGKYRHSYCIIQKIENHKP